jgi:hypothetical protein
MAKDTHRGHLLLRITPPHHTPTVTFNIYLSTTSPVTAEGKVVTIILATQVRRSGLFNFFSHPTKRVPQFNSIESPPPPAASYLLGGVELKGKRIRPESDPARAIWRHPICCDPTCVAGARLPKPLQNQAHFAPPTVRPAPDAPLDPPREF